ncbi:TRAP transporter substrate-binding protein DctP [Geitlerinema splendidum]|nr:TRAP transporter substrate-binding protein DctP [Geitlerinema splendidum]
MKRRNLLRYSAIATASTATLAACNPSTPPTTQSSVINLSQPLVRWRMATGWNKSLNVVFGAIDRFCQRVSQATNGRFSITPYEAGDLASALEVMDVVSDATVECGYTAGYHYIKKHPAFGFSTSMPFGLNSQQHNAWLYFGGGLEALQKIYSDYGILFFPGGNTGAQMGGWFTREINSAADLKGLKMRIPGLGGEVLKRLGVEIFLHQGKDIFKALESGEIQGAEWVGPYEDEKLGLDRVAPYYYYPGWWEPSTMYEIQVNQAAWNQLPKEYQSIFQSAAVEANLTMQSQYDAVNGEALERLTLKGVQLLSYSLEILQAAQKEAFALYEDTASQNAGFKVVYEQWKAFRTQAYRWNRINDLDFASFSFSQEM